jgi:hypothetical protein
MSVLLLVGRLLGLHVGRQVFELLQVHGVAQEGAHLPNDDLGGAFNNQGCGYVCVCQLAGWSADVG